MYTDIKEYKDAATKAAIDPNFFPAFPGLPERYQKAKEAEFKLDIIIEQMNNDPTFPNWKDPSLKKYELWLWVIDDEESLSGSGLSLLAVVYGDADSSAGSRRLFKDPKAARYCFETFKELFILSYLK